MPPIRDYYQDALYLAMALISEQSVRFREEGELTLPSLLLDMDVLFEDYVREVLRRQLHQLPGAYRAWDGNQAPPAGGQKMLFDEQPSESASPDVVIRSESDQSPVVIVEVKYKPLGKTPQRDDINQVIAYGASYRARAVVLAQPTKDSAEAGLHRLGTLGPLSVYSYGVDLGAQHLADVETAFARDMHRLLS
jgi:5-methylcytosine-specific restriction endonuclease McrBC regulatory subunit McrC